MSIKPRLTQFIDFIIVSGALLLVFHVLLQESPCLSLRNMAHTMHHIWICITHYAHISRWKVDSLFGWMVGDCCFWIASWAHKVFQSWAHKSVSILSSQKCFNFGLTKCFNFELTKVFQFWGILMWQQQPPYKANDDHPGQIDSWMLTYNTLPTWDTLHLVRIFYINDELQSTERTFSN